jgi:hypothetical protein
LRPKDIDSIVRRQKAAAATSEITGGKLDYLIHNAGFVPKFDFADGPGTL